MADAERRTRRLSGEANRFAGGRGRRCRRDYGAEVVAGYGALVNEIRLRQPQAKILLFAPLPRGQNMEAWRQRAQSSAAVFSQFVDDQTVFYADIGERFYLPDGSFKRETWSGGTQAAAFEIWAEELEPWLDRFVR